MQQCLHCGQYNEDYEDYCAYCGEELYIEIDHDDSRNPKMDHLYADSIAREIIDSNTNVFDNELNEVTKELLGEKEEDNKTFLMELDDYNFDTEEDISINDAQLIHLEQQLKNKLRRNKKLEAGMGLLIRNIDVILDDYTGPLIILGEITTNDKLDNKKVQLSAVSYDINKKQLSKNSTIVKVDHGNFEKFTITLDLEITETAIIIILPEMIRYDNDELNKQAVKEEKIVFPEEGNNIFIEQLVDIERKIGMTITNTSVLIKSKNSIEVVGEITIENPDKYHNIKIAATCYDKNNKIIGTESTKINTKLFLGFDTLSLNIENINVENIQRIRLYPTLQ